MTALGFLTASVALGPFVLADHVAHPRLATAYVTIGLLGGIVLFVTGFLYKIVPLLAWTVRYRTRMGKGAVPTVADTFSARVAHIQLAVMTAAVVLLAAGIAAALPHVVRCGALLYFAGTLLFASQLVRVSFGNRSL
jgi:hypothetical protein